MIPGLPKRPRHFSSNGQALTLQQMEFLGSQKTLVGLDLENSPLADPHVRKICTLPRVVNLGLEGTSITDCALKDLAKLPQLNFLRLDRTTVTGKGLVHFHSHANLRVLWLNETKVDDETIQLAGGIPRLEILLIDKTSVSFDAVLQLAACPRLDVVNHEYTLAQNEQYQARQRALKREQRTGRRTVKLDSGEAGTARTVLFAFFDAKNQWERKMGRVAGNPFTPQAFAELEAIFGQYCTVKKRSIGGSFSTPPKHAGEVETECEQETRNKFWFYMRDSNKFQRRYLLIRTDAGWRVDKVQWFSGGWQGDYL